MRSPSKIVPGVLKGIRTVSLVESFYFEQQLTGLVDIPVPLIPEVTLINHDPDLSHFNTMDHRTIP